MTCEGDIPAKSPSKRWGRRTTIRSHSKQNDCVRQSLQTCCLIDNKAVLDKHIKSLSSDDRKGNLRALIYILDTLLANVYSSTDGVNYELGFITSQQGFEMFVAFSKYADCEDSVHDKHLKIVFRDLLLHPLYGLCVCIYEDLLRGQRYIVLRPDNVNLSNFVQAIFGLESKNKKVCLEKSTGEVYLT